MAITANDGATFATAFVYPLIATALGAGIGIFGSWYATQRAESTRRKNDLHRTLLLDILPKLDPDTLVPVDAGEITLAQAITGSRRYADGVARLALMVAFSIDGRDGEVLKAFRRLLSSEGYAAEDGREEYLKRWIDALVPLGGA